MSTTCHYSQAQALRLLRRQFSTIFQNAPVAYLQRSFLQASPGHFLLRCSHGAIVVKRSWQRCGFLSYASSCCNIPSGVHGSGLRWVPAGCMTRMISKTFGTGLSELSQGIKYTGARNSCMRCERVTVAVGCTASCSLISKTRSMKRSVSPMMMMMMMMIVVTA